MCAQKVHTYNKRIEISETILYSRKYIYNNTYNYQSISKRVAKLLLTLYSS